MSFFSLQNFTTYSILSGVMEPKRWVARAKELGYKSLAITDKNTLAGHIEFQKDCEREGIKPIFGAEFSVTSDSSVKDKTKKADIEGNLLLYAKTSEGLKSLIGINNYANRREGGGFYYKPRICPSLLGDLAKDLICVVPNAEGFGRDKKDYLYALFKIFGADFYLGINPMLESESDANECNKGFASLPWKKVFIFNAHYPKAENAHLYDVVRGLDHSQNGQNNNFDREIENAHLPHFDEVVASYFKNHSHIEEKVFNECMENLNEFAEKCDAKYQLGTYYMPEVELKYGTIEEEVKAGILEGFKQNLCPDCDLDVLNDFEELRPWGDQYPYEHIAKGEKPHTHGLMKLDKYIDQIEYEFQVIEEMGFLDYFLVIKDVVDEAHRRGIEVGPGRGSAAGSIFSYLLGITKVDSIRHDLVFERFLSPDRKDLPDIDLDFEKDRREELKGYLEEKYGKEHVCSIGTYSRLKVISAIKKIAAANAYGIPDNDGNIVGYNHFKINNITANIHVTQTSRGEDELAELLENPDFNALYERHSKWFDEVIMPLQETITNTGIHAAGVLVTKLPLNESIPCFEHAKTLKPVSQFRDRHCEELGNPKLDLLGLKNLDKIAYAKRLIFERHGIQVPDIKEISLDDMGARKLFKNVKTEGIFQFLTYSQRNFHRGLKPDNFDEMVQSVAVIRPGPISAGVDKDYVSVKRGDKKVSYDHPDLKPILEETKGFLIFQEQVMRIVKEIGGLTGGQANALRKSVGKKKIDQMLEWEEVFKCGGQERGYSLDLLETLWDKIVAFAGYGFVKAHALAYTLISWEQAYLKSRYPAEYWSAVMQFADSDDKKEENVMDYKHIIRRDGLNFIYPNIYGFSDKFEPNEAGDSIYWPIDRVHGIGASASNELTKGKRHSFESLDKMVEECDARAVNMGCYKALIKAGFFNPLGMPWEAVEMYYEARQRVQKKKSDIPYEFSHKDMYIWTQQRNEAFKMIVEPWKEVAPFSDVCEPYPDDKLADVKDGEIICIGGYIEEIKNRRTKTGNDFATITVVDDGERIRVMAWSEYWANEDLDRLNKRPRKGDLVEIIGEKDSFSPPDSDRTYHQVTLGQKDPDLIRIVKFKEKD